MDSVSRVYIANYAGHDYTEAEAYGQLCYITRGFVSFDSLDRLKFSIAQAVADTQPQDWLLLSGTNIVNVLAALLWYEKHHVVKILNFDKTERTYRELVVHSGHLAQINEVLENGKTTLDADSTRT